MIPLGFRDSGDKPSLLAYILGQEGGKAKALLWTYSTLPMLTSAGMLTALLGLGL